MNGAKEILYNTEARAKLIAGINKLADAVKVTLGPLGRYVIMDKQFSAPRLTKDGVTVARDIELPDRFENMGASLIKQAAIKTLESAGDGTTTSTLLTQYLVNEGVKLIDEGANPVHLKRGMDKALKAILEYLDRIAHKIQDHEELVSIGTISANGDYLVGQLLASVIQKIGNDGIIHIEQGRKYQDEVFYTEGMTFPKGFMSGGFVTDPMKMITEMRDPLIFLSESIYTHPLGLSAVFKEYLDIFEIKQRGLVIICNDVQGAALEHLITNKMKGLPLVAIQAPYGGGPEQKAFFRDLEALTGATCFRKIAGKDLEKTFLSSHFGTVEKIVISSKSTTMIQERGEDQGRGEAVASQCNLIRDAIAASETPEEKMVLKERLARLSTGIATIKVGGVTESEILEKKDRVEDAMYAVKSALLEGFVAGGGSELVRAARSCMNSESAFVKELKEADKSMTLPDCMDFHLGIKIVIDSLFCPVTQLLANGGYLDSQIREFIDRMSNPGQGYDIYRGEFVNMIGAGIIDPVYVLKSALRDSVSIASLILTTEAIISSADGVSPVSNQPFRMVMPS